MAGNRFVFSGLDELKAELRNLPKDLAGEASEIIVDAAEGAANTVRQVYEQHRVTGRLARSVLVTKPGVSTYGTSMVVKVTDPIAWLFDNGSQERHWIGGKSTGIMWGRTPPTHIFARTMAKRRAAMYGALKDLLVEHGLIVTGKP
jgi:hypothetical protein